MNSTNNAPSSQSLFEEIENSFDWDDIIAMPTGDSGLEDKWQTLEQKKRDSKITDLLTAYVDFYQKKAKHSAIFKIIIFVICLLTLLIISGCLIAVTVFLLTIKDKQLGDFAAIISAYITMAISVMGVFKIVVGYIFPKDDEQYITEIVKAIQQNDLENKKENIRAKHDEIN